MFLRRHYDADSIAVSGGMVIGRSHAVDSNTAIACLDVFGSHAVKNVTYSNNKGRGCYRGAGFRGRDVKMIGNDLGELIDDTLIAIGGATNMAYSSSESPSVGHVVLTGNTGTGNGRGIQISDDLDSLNSNGNHIKCGLVAPASEVGIGYLLRGRRIRKVNIGSGDTIDLSDRADNAIGILIPNSDSQRLVLEDVTIKAKIIGAYKAISMVGTSLSTVPADNIHIDCHIVEAEESAVALTASAAFNDADGHWGRDVSIRVRYSGALPTNMLEMPVAANIIRFQRRPSFEFDVAKRFIGYGDATDLTNGETVSEGDYMYDPDTLTETYFTSDGTLGNDGSAVVTIDATETEGTITNGDLLAPGQHVTITGAGPASGNLSTTIVAKTSTTIEIADAAGTSVVDAAMAFINPTTATLVPT
jgi:hypothetical protein